MTVAQAAKKMERRQALASKEFAATTKGVAVSALARSKHFLTEQIYAIPEDVRKNGKKAWRRTGHLRRSEKFEIRDPYTVAIVNTAAYALPRHEAGKPGHRNINPLRISHWRDDLQAEFHEGLLRDLYHETVVAILKAGG